MADSPTLFTRIISGELPGRFVWRDPEVVAFLTIAPLRPGHTLVVPVEEVDRWTELSAETWARLCDVSRTIGVAIESSFDCNRVGVIVAGLEVPHCHIHLVPIRAESDLNFANADHDAAAGSLDAAADRIRAALRDAGAEHVSG
jgi:diadenosine tetraphosphate (Ap4A) HIT family hydrolase